MIKRLETQTGYHFTKPFNSIAEGPIASDIARSGFGTEPSNVSSQRGTVRRFALPAFLAGVAGLTPAAAAAQTTEPVWVVEARPNNPFFQIVTPQVAQSEDASLLRYQMDKGTIKMGDCVQTTEMVDLTSIYEQDAARAAGQDLPPRRYNHLFEDVDLSNCGIQQETPIAPAPIAPAVPAAPAPVAPAPAPSIGTPGFCPTDVTGLGNPMNLTDTQGNVIGQVFGFPSHVGPGGLDLAQGMFASSIHNLRNTVAEPGGMLVDKSLLSGKDLADWDARVNAGNAEYLNEGDNYFKLDGPSNSDLPTDAQGRTVLNVGAHDNLEADVEEGCFRVDSRERHLGFEFDQQSQVNGGIRGHFRLLLRGPYSDSWTLTGFKLTNPGTALQVVGKKVKDFMAFFSENALFQGVDHVRRDQPDVPAFTVIGANANDLSVGVVHSTGSGDPLHNTTSNYN